MGKRKKVKIVMVKLGLLGMRLLEVEVEQAIAKWLKKGYSLEKQSDITNSRGKLKQVMLTFVKD